MCGFMLLPFALLVGVPTPRKVYARETARVGRQLALRDVSGSLDALPESTSLGNAHRQYSVLKLQQQEGEATPTCLLWDTIFFLRCCNKESFVSMHASSHPICTRRTSIAEATFNSSHEGSYTRRRHTHQAPSLIPYDT